MVKFYSTTRFPSITHKVILTQTDTTVGFLSQDPQKLSQIKLRDNTKPFIKVYANFKALTRNTRLPKQQKKQIRRAKKTTFIVKNQSFRVAPHQRSSMILQNVDFFYSTSANASGKHFERAFCEHVSDILIENNIPLFEGKASKLIKLNNTKRKRLR